MARLRELLARLAALFRPEPGTTEGAAMLGLLLAGLGFLVSPWPWLAGVVPGLLLVAISLGLSFTRRVD